MKAPKRIFHYALIAFLILLLLPVIIVLLALLYVNVLFPLFFTVFPSECTVTEQPVNINAGEYNYANNCQKNASVWMAEHDGRLRKYYRITEAGRRRLAAFRTEWDEILAVYRFVTREEESHE